MGLWTSVLEEMVGKEPILVEGELCQEKRELVNTPAERNAHSQCLTHANTPTDT